MYDTIDYTKVPVSYMADGMQRYVEKGIRPGDFVIALLSNDLVNAVGRADSQNQAALVDWIKFMYNELPSGCWGTPEKVQNWLGTDADPRRQKVIDFLLEMIDDEDDGEVIEALEAAIESVKNKETLDWDWVETTGTSVYEATAGGGMYGDTDYSDMIQDNLSELLELEVPEEA